MISRNKRKRFCACCFCLIFDPKKAFCSDLCRTTYNQKHLKPLMELIKL